jgi:hypothetical protein
MNVLEETVSKFEKQTGLSGHVIPFKCDLYVKDEVLGDCLRDVSQHI